jgi:PAS domain S-box-containing protein
MTLEQDILEASILVVDDQADQARQLTDLLAACGYSRVASTTRPAEVPALHGRHHHDLILLDLQMPSVDGLGVMAELKTQHPGGELPVIVLTARPDDKLRALRAGARDYIGRPLDAVDVKTRIHHMLEASVLYRRLQAQTQELERLVHERTAELRESEARYRSLAELASDWYWEQNAQGEFTRLSGPVIEMLGIHADALMAESVQLSEDGWNIAERRVLQANIAARRPFLDFTFHRVQRDGSRQQFRVSGQPMFDDACRYIGYRGIGVEVTPGR